MAGFYDTMSVSGHRGLSMAKQWSVNDLAAALQHNGRALSTRHIRRLCDGGTIEASKVARDWVISDAAARQFIREWTGREWRGN
jgi:hypothetical protein